MAEEQEPQEVEPTMPPASEEGTNPRREKKKGKKITQGKLFVGVLGIMALVAGYNLFLKDDSAPPIPGSDEEVDLGGAEVETDVVSFGREDSDTGGVGQERAEVLAEIDEREALKRRIQGGQSAVRFGEEVNEEPEAEPEKPKERGVFGDVERREPAPKKPASRRAPQVAPISGTRSPQPYGSGSNGGGAANGEAIAYELGLMAEEPLANTTVNYHIASADTGARAGMGGNRSHPFTPELDKDGRGDREKKETIALPGDMTVAYLSNRISSDQPSGRVRADILAGDLRGGRMLGEATFEGERLIINFDQLVFEDEVYGSVHAVAVDPNSLDASVQDGINRRLFTRYGIPVLAGVAAIGIDYQAERRSPSVTETNLSTGETVTRRNNDADGFGEYAATEAADGLKTPLEAIATNAAATKPEVWANPGAIGLMFTTEVVR